MRKKNIVLLCGMFFIFCAASSQSFADLWVVVASENKQTLDLEEIKKIFKGDVKKWDSGKSIVIVVPDTASKEGEIMLNKIYEMSAKKYTRYWIEKIFNGEASGTPENKNGDSMKEFIKAYPNAIGILRGNYIDGTIRGVLKLD